MNSELIIEQQNGSIIKTIILDQSNENLDDDICLEFDKCLNDLRIIRVTRSANLIVSNFLRYLQSILTLRSSVQIRFEDYDKIGCENILWKLCKKTPDVITYEYDNKTFLNYNTGVEFSCQFSKETSLNTRLHTYPHMYISLKSPLLMNLIIYANYKDEQVLRWLYKSIPIPESKVPTFTYLHKVVDDTIVYIDTEDKRMSLSWFELFIKIDKLPKDINIFILGNRINIVEQDFGDSGLHYNNLEKVDESKIMLDDAIMCPD